MAKEYVEQRNGGYYILGTRVSLDSVVYAFLQGESADGIVESFPVLNLEQVYGGLAFYLANRDLIDQYLREGEKAYEALYEESRRLHPAFYKKLEEARQKSKLSTV